MLYLVCILLCSLALPICGLDSVEIIIDSTSIDSLEAHPFSDQDVYGDFIAGGSDTYDSIELHYRGSYALLFLMEDSLKQRNWKVKVGKDKPYRGYREWNYNYELHLRQKLSYDVFGMAGVPVVNARNVILSVNGDRHGLYTEYQDPDNKNWLVQTFGYGDGDLYKAAIDIPDQPRYFAEFTFLGAEDSSYYFHYTKKSSAPNSSDLDYHTIREFITGINTATDEQFETWLRSNFAVAEFMKYLVVANFVSFWDGYPNRGKNYWLYYNTLTKIWHFIPWDLDANFQNAGGCLQNMGPATGLFFMQYQKRYCAQPFESRERPLFTRMMKVRAFRDEYIAEYTHGLESYLQLQFLLDTLHALRDLALPELDSIDSLRFSRECSQMESYIQMRYDTVTQMVAAYLKDPEGYYISPVVRQPARVENAFPVQAIAGGVLQVSNPFKTPVRCRIVNVNGRVIIAQTLKNQGDQVRLSGISPGLYFFSFDHPLWAGKRQLIFIK